VLLRLTVLLLGLAALSARAVEYPWIYLVADRDSRDAEVRTQDEQRSLFQVAVINQQETLFEHHLVWQQSRITDLLSRHARSASCISTG
jgi:hypothetical protein